MTDATESARSGGTGNATETVTTVAGRLRRGLRLFTSAGDQPRARRATDVILLTISFVGIVFVGLVAIPEPGFSRAVTSFLGALPDALAGMWQVLADLPTLWALVVLGAAFTRGRAKVGRDMILAILVGLILWLILGRVVTGAWPEMRALFGDIQPPVAFPPARLGIPTALLITASPHLVRPARRLGYAIIGLGSIAFVTLGASSSLGAAAALLSAAGAAAVVHLMVGSSAGRPSLDDVRFALADLKVDITELGAADRQDAGFFAVAAQGSDGSELIVKLYGRDAHDAALVSTLWRTVWLRGPGSPVGFGRLRQVEHEALMTLLAAQAGIATDSVVTAGATATDDALLVLRRSGTLLVEPDRFREVDAAPDPIFTGADARPRLRELWQLLATLHDNGLVHGQLDEEFLVIDDGHLGLVHFRGAAVAPTPAQRHGDDAQLFITSIGLVGRELALEGLVEHRSVEAIEGLLPYLQPTALTADQRRMMKVLDVDLDALRAEVAEASGVEAPPLIRMRRFTFGSVIRVALPALAIVMLLSALAGFDLEAFLDSLQDAAWWLVAIGFIVAQLPRIAQAVSTLGAAPIALPLGPVYALQLAISYVNLAIPTAAARIAVNVRFFQRQGVPPATAVATGALDGVSGFIVQALLLGSLLLFGGLSLDVDLGGPASAAVRIAWMLVVVLAVAVLVILVIPRLRRYVLGGVRRTVHEAFTVLRGLRSLRRLVMLFGGNLVAELLFALALGVFVQSFGYSLALHELLFINMAVSLLAGLLPVPGGVGVTEGGLIFGLTSFGVPQEVAFAAVMLYRFSTFYTPPIWGFFLPASVDDYVRCCELLEHGADRQQVVLAPKGSLTIEQLVEFGADHPRPGRYLRFVDTPFTRIEVAKWRVRRDRPRFHDASRLARVGVFSRGLDALNRASLIFRGRNASGTEAAAETQYRTGMQPDRHPYYGRVVRDSGYTVLQYWFFYAYNDWRSRVFGVNDHEADWEQITIYLAGQHDELHPVWLVSSAHDEVGDDLRRRWDDPDLTIEGQHPIVYAGLGSHSGAYLAGEYLTTHDIPAFARLLKLTRRISHIFFPWTRDVEHSGLSIPYIDYARGDGVAIGPGQDRRWDPVVIDETTPWVMQYRGLWGNDTRDPLGGERGPAGPRYERSTTVRGSWGDPVGWAGLRKVAPDTAAAADALRTRLGELDTEVEQLDARIEQHQIAQRAAVAGGENVSDPDEAQLVALAAARVALRDQQFLLGERLGRPPAAVGPHDHLRHRRLPLPTETTGRRRVLAIWSAVSTSVVLVVLMIIVLAPGWDVDGIAIETVIALFALEALARKQLLRFALLVVAFLVVGALVLALSGALLADWQLVVAFLLGLAAAALLFLNVRELLRD